MVVHRPSVRPPQKAACRIGAESLGIRHYPHSSQIQSISIPADLKRLVTFSETIRVEAASIKKQIEPVIIQGDECAR